MGEEAALNAPGGPEAEAAGAPIPAFRAAHQAEEAELFDRIRRLEGMLGHQIIARLEPDGYLTEVQENLTSAAFSSLAQAKSDKNSFGYYKIFINQRS